MSYLCEHCGSEFKHIQSLNRHLKNHKESKSQNKCVRCDKIFKDNANFVKHNKVCCVKTTKGDPPIKKIHKRRFLELSEIEKFISKFADVAIYETAFRRKIIAFIINNSLECKDEKCIKSYLDLNKTKVLALLKYMIACHHAVKFQLVLKLTFVKEENNEIKTADFFVSSKFTEFFVSSASIEEFEKVLSIQFVDCAKKADEFQKNSSGWLFNSIDSLVIKIAKYNPFKASSFIKTPEDIIRKQALINVQNNDELCFVYSVLSYFFRKQNRTVNLHRAEKYRDLENHLATFKINVGGLDFPLKIHDIHKFEAQNHHISINVFGLQKTRKSIHKSSTKKKIIHEVIGPFYHTKVRKINHINLLLLSDNNNVHFHYCLITDFSRLVTRQLTRKKAKKYFCDGCLISFCEEFKLKSHHETGCYQTKIILPTNKPFIQFDAVEKTIFHNFICVADFESILKPIEEVIGSKTTGVQLHEACAFAYKIIPSIAVKSDYFSALRIYSGIDCASKFIQMLREDCQHIFDNYLTNVFPLSLSIHEENVFRFSEYCHICNLTFDPSADDPKLKKVRDHNHFGDGAFRGAAHASCNLRYQNKMMLPIFLHNLSKYDASLFIHELAVYENDPISVIGLTHENYISFNQKFDIGVNSLGKKVKFEMRFLDSLRFLNASIDNIVKSLPKSDLHHTRTEFPDGKGFDLMSQKGHVCFDYLQTFDSLLESQLPPREKFRSLLTGKDISNENYEHVLSVFKHFNCNSILDYLLVYLKSDVTLLADIVENFRKIFFTEYGLDMAHFFTLPGLSWTAMLKFSGEKIELMTDIDQIYMVNQGLRGGINQAVLKNCEANNRYMGDFYDPSLPESYLLYLDKNNLYGEGLSCSLPLRNFEWLTAEDIEIFDVASVADDASHGYILDVDLSVPVSLHDLHNDMSWCPEIREMSDGTKRLLLTLDDKKGYIIHYRMLKACLKNGLILDKINRVIKFEQKPFIKGFIAKNTALRAKASSTFERDIYKLNNNSIYGRIN